MGMLIPLSDKGVQPLGQMDEVGKVGDAQPLALQDAEPLFHLIHPRTVDRREVAHKARMGGQPGAHQRARVHAQVIQQQMDRRDGRGNLLVELLQKGDELDLPFAQGGRRIDVAAARVEGGEEIEGTAAFVFVFDAHGAAPPGRTGWGQPGARLQAGLLVPAQDDLPRLQWARVEVHELLHLAREGGIARLLGREPQVVPPRLELVVAQDAPHRLVRDVVDQSFRHQRARDLGTVPLAERAATVVGALTGDLDHVQRHRRGGKRAAVPGVAGRAARRSPRRRSAWPTCARAARPGRLGPPCACRAARLPGAAWPVPAWPAPPAFSAGAASPPTSPAWRHRSPPSTGMGVRALLSPSPLWWPEYSKQVLISTISYPISVGLY